jgi:hypothetical protein
MAPAETSLDHAIRACSLGSSMGELSGRRKAARGSKKEHPQGSPSREAQTHYRPPTESHANGPGKTSCEGA